VVPVLKTPSSDISPIRSPKTGIRRANWVATTAWAPADGDQLQRIIDMIASDFFSGGKRGLFQRIVNSLLDEGDRYTVLADFETYVDCQWKASLPRLSRRRLELQVHFERGAHGTIFQ
jgi:hypothetical protein